MALLDVLKERTERRTSTAQVSCGELGLLRVEALPPAELARLPADRAVLYAACRELQSAGETLRRAGKLFAPDEITAYLSDEEAAAGAAAVREISGVSVSRRDSMAGPDAESGDQDGSASRTETAKIRLDAVQEENHVYSESRHARKSGTPRVRPDSVQEKGEILTSVGQDFPEIRLSSVQGETEAPASDAGAKPLQAGRGQDSREFSDREARTRKTDKKSRDIVALPGEGTPNLGQTPVRPGDSEVGAAHEIKSEIPEKLHETTSESGRFGAGAAHEIKSDFREELHEITSESAESGIEVPHETKSELRETLHETESEIHPAMWEGLHETTSEQAASKGEALHETESESVAVTPAETHTTMGKVRKPVHELTSEREDSGAGALHEVKSELRERPHEIRSEVRNILHEMESELTDRVAKGLLDGLRRAAVVR